MLFIPQIGDYKNLEKILTYDEVRDFVVLNFAENYSLNYMKNKIREKLLNLFISFPTTIDEVETTAKMAKSNYSDHCEHRYSIHDYEYL